MKLMSVKQARQEWAIGKQVTLRGWVRTRRDSKAGFSFIELNDGSCQGNIQIIAPNSLDNYEQTVRKLNAGCSIYVRGLVKESAGKGQTTEVEASEVGVYGWADPQTYPLQKKRHSFEKLREWAHLRPRTNSLGAVTRVRNAICHSIHRFFYEEGFLYIHTPIITASDAEGAGELFQVTTLDLNNVPQQPGGGADFSRDFFERPTFLTVSGQLEVEAFACSLGNVYTFGPTFRAERSTTSRHLAEFWMVEPEMAFYELTDNMDLAERFLKRIIDDVLEECQEDMDFFQARIDSSIIETLQAVRDATFQRISYTEAIQILHDAAMKFEYTVEWGADLQSEHERFLTEQYFKSPVILFDYPRAIKPFYMYCNDDGKTVRGMDVLVPRVGEIIGGSQREHRLEMLETRMTETNMDHDQYWWYRDLRRYGTVPHSGFGLGLERLVQFVTGMGNIREVIPFPRTPGNAEF